MKGHVDAVGALASIAVEGEFAVYRWSYPAEYAPLLVNKGSVDVDGVSLTVVEPDASTFGGSNMARDSVLPAEGVAGHAIFLLLVPFALGVLGAVIGAVGGAAAGLCGNRPRLPKRSLMAAAGLVSPPLGASRPAAGASPA